MATLDIDAIIISSPTVIVTQSLRIDHIPDTIRATAVNPVTLDGSGTTTPTEPTLTFYW